MEEKQGLSSRELLESVYNALKEGCREIQFSSRAMAEIADDSDWHRSRTGYTGYESAALFNAGGKKWAVAFGIKCGSYPADPYNCDIAAVELTGGGNTNKEIAAEVQSALRRNSYFRDSLVYAMADGQLKVKKDGRFSKKTLELLGPKVQEFVAKDVRIDPNYLTMDLRPVVKSAVRYKPEFVAFLRDTFRTLLSS
ncbi:MAG: hypothetical protein PHC85_02310 [Candidatus Pacebacteria bacterium]|nr:hypothetical protein [Candidatus Paceibacterota bacterium]